MARLSRYLCVALALLLRNHALAWSPLHHHKPSKVSQSHKIQKRIVPPPPALLVQAGILSSLLVPFSADAAETLTKSRGTPLEIPVVIFAAVGAIIIGRREDQKVQQEETAAKLQKKRTSQLAAEIRASLQSRLQKERQQRMTLPIPIQQAAPSVQAQAQPVPVPSQPTYQQPPPPQQQQQSAPPPQPAYAYSEPTMPAVAAAIPATSAVPRQIPQRTPTSEEEAFLRGYAKNQSRE
jgi:hypothetical protein